MQLRGGRALKSIELKGVNQVGVMVVSSIVTALLPVGPLTASKAPNANLGRVGMGFTLLPPLWESVDGL